MSEAVTFLASFPPIQSAIKVGQDGARVQLDIPETEMPSIVRLMLLRGMVLRITIEPETALKNKQKQDAPKRNNQQSQWQARQEPGDDRDP